MANDMDIDMDLDLGPVEDDAMFEIPAVPIVIDIRRDVIATAASDIPPDPDVLQVIPHKVHLRGLDNLTDSDIKGFTSEYFSGTEYDDIEWIDDTSANLVYKTSSLAMEALVSLTDANVGDISQIPPLQMIQAKPVPLHPDTHLYIRFAVAGDKKKPGARERSRFYLLNPDHDPAERRKGGGYRRRGGRRYRDRDEGDQRGGDVREPFDASLYDDDEISRTLRASKSQDRRDSRSSISSAEYQSQGVRKTYSGHRNTKELFPDRLARCRTYGGRLRDRSASPPREVENTYAVNDRSKSRLQSAGPSGVANRLQAQMIKARLKEASMESKELFPQKAAISHRRSDAFDATDAAADLFASRMPVPFLDGSNDIKPRKQDLMSRITKPDSENSDFPVSSSDQNGLSIRGQAAQQSAGISIKGTALASETSVKELFPHKSGINAGKELFSEKLEGRGGRRQRAEDMFY